MYRYVYSILKSTYLCYKNGHSSLAHPVHFKKNKWKCPKNLGYLKITYNMHKMKNFGDEK